MCIPAISSSVLSQITNVQRTSQQVRSEFRQLGQDLQSGDVTRAQTDFVTLSKDATSEFGGDSLIVKTLSAIGQALQSGNITAAQEAYSSVPIALVGPCAAPHGQVGLMQGQFQAVLNHLGQMVQTGNLPAAQQAFAAVEQLWSRVVPAVASPTSGSTSLKTSGQ
ncbi:MAG TPA: hypothetical protein VKB58_18525 [Terriglobales bacterium]|nr:hypothetical protein [Terriglobales bacterium]